jgi:flagellar biosynthesis/type III secretory pathway protein FliH
LERVKKIEGPIGEIFMNEVLSIKKTLEDENENEDRLSFEDQVILLKEERRNLKDQQDFDIETAKKKGYEAGYETGHVKGILDGIEYSKELNEKNVDSINNIILGIEGQLERKNSELNKIISIAIGNALKNSYFLNIEIDNEGVSKVVEASLSSLPLYAKNITINVSEDDYKIIKSSHQEMNIKKDTSLLRGEVIIETDVNVVSISGDQMAKDVVKKLTEDLNAVK